MSNVINFPNGKERIAFKRNIAKNKLKDIFQAILQFISKAIHGIFFIMRLTVATTLHYVFYVSLSILSKMNVLLSRTLLYH